MNVASIQISNFELHRIGKSSLFTGFVVNGDEYAGIVQQDFEGNFELIQLKGDNDNIYEASFRNTIEASLIQYIQDNKVKEIFIDDNLPLTTVNIQDVKTRRITDTWYHVDFLLNDSIGINGNLSVSNNIIKLTGIETEDGVLNITIAHEDEKVYIEKIEEVLLPLIKL
ncbi:hypothetical protein [Pseudoneobacillus sp. C159]